MVSLAGNNRSALPCLQDNGEFSVVCCYGKSSCTNRQEDSTTVAGNETNLKFSHLTKMVKVQLLYKLLEAGNSAWFL